MTDVPFSKLGEQSVRLAWQVLGKEGPIPNPTGIRYLLPGELSQKPASLSSVLPNLATGLAGVNLLVASGTLAVSTVTLAEVKRLSIKLDSLLAAQERDSKKLDHIVEKLSRIELKVSESRLAKLVDHAIHSAARGSNEIGFEPFADLAGDLESFIEEAEIVRGVVAKFRLGSDVRMALRRICELLRGVRWQAAQAYNRTCERPDRMWLCDPDKDYWPDWEAILSIEETTGLIEYRRNLQVAVHHAHQSVDACFSMNGIDDHLALQQALDLVHVQALMNTGMDETDAGKLVSEAHEKLGPFESKNGDIKFLDQSFVDGYVESMCKVVKASIGTSATVVYPEELFSSESDGEGSDVLSAPCVRKSCRRNRAQLSPVCDATRGAMSDDDLCPKSTLQSFATK